MNILTTRRAALIGAAALSTSLAASLAVRPVASAVTDRAAPLPLDRSDAEMLHFLKTAEPAELARFHATSLGAVLGQLHGRRFNEKLISTAGGDVHVFMFLRQET